MSTHSVVAVDFTELSKRALAWVLDHERGRDARIVLVHAVLLTPVSMAPDAVIPMPGPTAGERTELLARLRDFGRLGGVPDDALDVEVVYGLDAGEAIVTRAAELGATLIALGTHGRGAIARAFTGSVADHVVRHARCPVLTIRE